MREIESGDPVVLSALKEILSGAWGDNILADDELLDVPSGNAVLCGIPITITQTA